MTEIYPMTQGHPYWSQTISLAANCSWKAGSCLAEKMEMNAFTRQERVFAACVDEKVAGFCTFSEKDELATEYEFTPFIGFIFVSEQHRGKRISELMIQRAALYAHTLGHQKIYIMSGEIGLYEKYCFEKLGDYKTIYGSTDQLFVKSTSL